jgi:hypothetical protein
MGYEDLRLGILMHHFWNLHALHFHARIVSIAKLPEMRYRIFVLWFKKSSWFLHCFGQFILKWNLDLWYSSSSSVLSFIFSIYVCFFLFWLVCNIVRKQCYINCEAYKHDYASRVCDSECCEKVVQCLFPACTFLSFSTHFQMIHDIFSILFS